MPGVSALDALTVDDAKALLKRSESRGKLAEAAEYLVMKIDKRLNNPAKFRGKLVTRSVLKSAFDSMPHIDQSSLLGCG